jgi:hypothetical protein
MKRLSTQEALFIIGATLDTVAKKSRRVISNLWWQDVLTWPIVGCYRYMKNPPGDMTVFVPALGVLCQLAALIYMLEDKGKHLLGAVVLFLILTVIQGLLRLDTTDT